MKVTRQRTSGAETPSSMEVFTGNGQKDSQVAFEKSSSHESFSEVSPSTVLLVDDDAEIRSLTRTFLEHEGYSVFSSGDAERGAQIFRSVPQIDLLVTDLYMPGRSGIDLGLELKAIRKELPVLMISGGLLDADHEQRLKAEGWSFLAKPFRLPEFLAMVHRILAPVQARRWREAKRGVTIEELLPRHE
jgi:DNA-binding response OmpR family regulator